MTVIQGTEGKTRIIFENSLAELGLSCSKWDVQLQHFGYSYWPVIFFLGNVFVWYQGDGDVIESLWECSFSVLQKSLRRIGSRFSLYVW